LQAQPHFIKEGERGVKRGRGYDIGGGRAARGEGGRSGRGRGG